VLKVNPKKARIIVKYFKNLTTLTSPVNNKIVFNIIFILHTTILNINLNY